MGLYLELCYHSMYIRKHLPYDLDHLSLILSTKVVQVVNIATLSSHSLPVVQRLSQVIPQISKIPEIQINMLHEKNRRMGENI